MNWFGVIGIMFGIFGIAYAGRFYWELRKWAYLIKYARVVIAYKGKVKMNAPLQEWALWCRNADSNKSSHGHEIYSMGGTRVAVLGKSFVPDPPVIRQLKLLTKKLKPTRSEVNPQVQEGTWKATDHTKKVRS